MKRYESVQPQVSKNNFFFWKGLSETNTLAYLAHLNIKKKKGPRTLPKLMVSIMFIFSVALIAAMDKL